jgi:predicted O-methyltransferase YrrM
MTTLVPELERVIGCPPDSFCDSFYAKQPPWARGASISHHDARFLFRKALEAGTETAVEIGTASGFSTGVLCLAMSLASEAGLIGPDYRVISYDISPRFYMDRTRPVGDAAREQLPPELARHLEFRHPLMSLDVAREHGENGIEFLFIDADHRHPWPAFDLLATIDTLAPGATVLIHDINLPVLHPEFPHRGAKYLFDGLDVEKDVPRDAGIPNIGSIRIPEDKAPLRARLREIVFAHEWETDVLPEYLALVGLPGHG